MAVVPNCTCCFLRLPHTHHALLTFHLLALYTTNSPLIFSRAGQALSLRAKHLIYTVSNVAQK